MEETLRILTLFDLLLRLIREPGLQESSPSYAFSLVDYNWIIINLWTWSLLYLSSDG